MTGLTKTYPTLYGLTSKGKVKIWDVNVRQEKTQSVIQITHGELHGTTQTAIRKITEGKNLNKANETTIYEQACLEAQALWNKKCDKGYQSQLHDLTAKKTKNESRLPMLALKYEDRKHDLVWPVFVQPKLNGVRCLLERRGDEILFHSRGGKQFTTLDHIKQDAMKVLRDGEMIDGELYCHKDLTFQELVSLIKNDKQKEENAEKLQRYVKFWNYDRCESLPFKERSKSLVNRGSICNVQTWTAQNEAEVLAIHTQVTQDGYEGTMIRSGGDEPYRFQYRSPTLLKLKDFVDEEFQIVDVKEGIGKDEGKAIFKCALPNGKTFDVRCAATDEERTIQWKRRHTYVKKWLTVKFQNLSDDGVPIFPVGISIRDYE